MNEKLCPSCHDMLSLDQFRRMNSQGKIVLHQTCNDCFKYEQLLLKRREQILNQHAPIKKPQTKPVWMVVYRSFP